MAKEIKLSTGVVVKMREPKVRDMMSTDDVVGQAKQELMLVSSVTQLTEDEILDLTMKDYGLIQKALQGFLE